MKKRLVCIAAVCAMVIFISTSVFGSPVSVNATGSGSSGNWLIDFSFSNTIGVNNMDIYFMGVNAPNATIVGIPTGYVDYGFYNGYNLSWLDYGTNLSAMIHNGETKSGFTILDTSATQPSSISWFAYAFDWTGQQAEFNGETNPYFEGTTNVSAPVPEPGTMMLLGIGMAGLAIYGKRRKSNKA